MTVALYTSHIPTYVTILPWSDLHPEEQGPRMSVSLCFLCVYQAWYSDAASPTQEQMQDRLLIFVFICLSMGYVKTDLEVLWSEESAARPGAWLCGEH